MNKFNDYEKGWYIVSYGLGWTCDFFDGECWLNQSEALGKRNPSMAPLIVGEKIAMPEETSQSNGMNLCL